MSEKKAAGKARPSAPVNPADPTTVPKFVDPVPRPEVLQPIGKEHGLRLYRVAFRQVEQRLHRDFPLTTVWG